MLRNEGRKALVELYVIPPLSRDYRVNFIFLGDFGVWHIIWEVPEEEDEKKDDKMTKNKKSRKAKCVFPDSYTDYDGYKNQ